MEPIGKQLALKSSQGSVSGTITTVSTGAVQTVTRSSWRDRQISNTSVNPGGNNLFESQSETITGSLIDGPRGTTLIYEKVPSAMYTLGGLPSHLSYPSDVGQKLMAITNPSRPSVRLPVFLAELRDLPEMVRQMGHLAILVRDRHPKPLSAFGGGSPTAGAAKLSLLHNFGFMPFIEDIFKIAALGDSINRRKKELAGLTKNGGLRRTMKNLHTASVTQSGFTAYDSAFTSVPYIQQKKTVVSGGCLWKETYPGSSNIPYSGLRALLLGLDPGNIAADIWEGLPWSWLTDYFSNIGQALQAGNRTIATPYRAWIKVRTTTDVSHPTQRFTTGGKTLVLSAGASHSRFFSRIPTSGGGSIAASLPFLGSGQLSTLGSLAVVKNLKVLRMVM